MRWFRRRSTFEICQTHLERSAWFMIAIVVASCSTVPSDTAQRSTDRAGTVRAPDTALIEGLSASTEHLVVRDEWGELFEAAGVIGTIAVREVGSDDTQVWNVDRVRARRRPASTFKILNSLIILETGTLADVDTIVAWDGVVREVPDWNQDHTLRSGIDVSAVWMYQILARRVGAERMLDWIERVGYGNETLGGDIDDFWLRGELAISPLEQIDFLERLVNGDLPFGSDGIEAVAEIIVQERGDGWSWSYKTGTALAEDPDLGWLVGATEVGERRWVFALNLDLEAGVVVGQIDPVVRQRIARQILVDVGALPR